MKYLLINRENRVVDILDQVRYIKLQSPQNIVIACEEQEATGVIGSNANTHYVLTKADTLSSKDAVSVMEVTDEVSSGVIVGYSKLNTTTNEFEYDLDVIKLAKQEENKLRFATYLALHPLTWVDGKEYGVTEQDQSEISLNINQYQIAVSAGVETPILEWHARHEECKPWTLEDLSALSLAISAAVYPKYHQMQQYKTAIYAATSIEDLNNIIFEYEEAKDETVAE